MEHDGKYKSMPKITGNDVCVAMHTALRKCCDSKAASAMYQVVHLICALEIKPKALDPWRLLGDLVAEKINEAHAENVEVINPYIYLQDIVRGSAFADAWYKRQKPRRQNGKSDPENATESLYALKSIFALFQLPDWEGMTAYLKDGDAE